MKMEFYDFHTHLNDFKLYPKREEYLKNFLKKGGRGLVNVGVNFEWNVRGIEIAKKSKNLFQKFYSDFFIFATIGYHPSEIYFQSNNNFSRYTFEKWVRQKINELKKFFLENKSIVVGIGECGIDMHYQKGKDVLEFQKQLFALQCELAQELDLPLIVHSREDFGSTFDILKSFKNLKIYFHCWGYGLEEAGKVLSYFKNVWIGFTGNITYPKADKLIETLKKIPFQNLVLETDSPYLTPQVKRGQINEPANVVYIYKFVAKFRKVEIDMICNMMKENFINLYGYKYNIVNNSWQGG